MSNDHYLLADSFLAYGNLWLYYKTSMLDCWCSHCQICDKWYEKSKYIYLPWNFSTQSQTWGHKDSEIRINDTNPAWTIPKASWFLNRSYHFDGGRIGEVGLLGKGSAVGQYMNWSCQQKEVIKIHLPERSPDFPCNVQHSLCSRAFPFCAALSSLVLSSLSQRQARQ